MNNLNAMKIPATISEVEEAIQTFLEDLRSELSMDSLAVVRPFLVPANFKPVVQFQEDGRKKRGTAKPGAWSPEWGEILIYFEPSETETGQPQGGQPPSAPEPSARATAFEPNDNMIAELCLALDEAERMGRAFIALRWFRDEYLLTKGFTWARDTEHRQAVLAVALARNVVTTSRIPNPKNPQFPTTTIKLNRTHHGSPGSSSSRFSPVRISGDSLSKTIDTERGRR